MWVFRRPEDHGGEEAALEPSPGLLKNVKAVLGLSRSLKQSVPDFQNAVQATKCVNSEQ